MALENPQPPKYNETEVTIDGIKKTIDMLKVSMISMGEAAKKVGFSMVKLGKVLQDNKDLNRQKTRYDKNV